MPRNLTWVQKLSVTDRNEIEGSAGSLRNFADEEVMPPEISSELQKYAGFLETLAGDEADDREKEKALNGMYAFSSFLYGNGFQITEILEPEKAESFQKLAKAVNDKLDLRINLGRRMQSTPPAVRMASTVISALTERHRRRVPPGSPRPWASCPYLTARM